MARRVKRKRGSFRLPLPVVAALVGASFAAAFGASAAGCFAAADDCELNLGYGCSDSSTGGGGGADAGSTTSVTSSSSSGGAGGAGGTTTSTGTTGGGGSGGCQNPIDCPSPAEGPCQPYATCQNNVCGVAYTAGPALNQKPGDCFTRQCDAAGMVTLVPDDTDVLDDGDACTTNTCSSGAAVSMVNDGAPCANGFCTSVNGVAKCVQCTQANMAACTGGKVCVSYKCVPASCNNALKDGSETDLNCGGLACPPCGVGLVCAVDNDCVSGKCGANLKCAPVACNDMVLNGTETDVDCGGGGCNPCDNGWKCLAHTDCMSVVCDMGVCQAPTCLDGVKNGDETGIDCGGSCPWGC